MPLQTPLSLLRVQPLEAPLLLMGMVRSRHYRCKGDRTHQYSYALVDVHMVAAVPRVLTDGCPTQATTTFMASRLSPSTPRPRRVSSGGSTVTFRPTRALSTSLAAEPPIPRENVTITLIMSGGNQRDAEITVSKFTSVNIKGGCILSSITPDSPHCLQKNTNGKTVSIFP